jgi:hypothetical protein
VKAAAIDQGLPEPASAWRSKTKKRNYRQQLRRWELHFEDHFAGARNVLSNHLDEYITARREEEAKDPTIQRELSLLTDQRSIRRNRIAEGFITQLAGRFT